MKMRLSIGLHIICTLILISLFSGCKKEQYDELWYLNNAYNELSEKENISQMFLITVDPSKYYSNPDYKKCINGIFSKYRPGGVFFDLPELKNIEETGEKTNSRRILDAVIELNRITGLPLIVAADMPCGAWKFDKDAAHFTLPIGLAATGNTIFAYRQGKITAAEARLQGINMLINPCLNRYSDTDDSDSFTYSFGNDLNVISTLGINYIKGCQEMNVISCMKYFPSQTFIDSVSGKSESEDVFKTASENGVMAALLRPVSPDVKDFSDQLAIINNIRNKIGFKGLLIQPLESGSDSSVKHINPDFLINGVKTGIDMYIIPETTNLKINEIDDFTIAFYSKKIELTEIKKTSGEIYSAKKQLKLKEPALFSKNVKLGLGLSEFHQTAKEISDSSVIVIKNNNGIIPIDKNDNGIYMIVFDDDRFPLYSSLFKEKYNEHVNVPSLFEVFRVPDSRIKEEIVSKASKSTKVVCTFFCKPDDKNMHIIREISESNNNLIIISFYGTGLLADVPKTSGYILCYSQSTLSFVSVLDVLFGNIKATGILHG